MSAAHDIRYSPSKSLDEIAAAVIAAHGLTLEQLQGADKTARCARARWDFALLARQELRPGGKPWHRYVDIAAFLHRTVPTVLVGVQGHLKRFPLTGTPDGIKAKQERPAPPPRLLPTPPPNAHRRPNTEEVVFVAVRAVFERQGYAAAVRYCACALKRIARRNRSAVEGEGWIA